MDTIKIRYLDFLKTELQFEKKNALHINCYSRTRNLNIQIRKVERDIKYEQIKLWNYVLNESISVTNFQLFEDIFRYFDQKNYQSRMIDKIENQILFNQKEVTRSVSLQHYEFASAKQNENLYLMYLLNKRYAVNEEEIVEIVFR